MLATSDVTQTVLFGNPAFDPILKKWMRCPICGNLEIDQKGDLGPWQGCYDCGIFLNPDGHRVKMRYYTKAVQ